MSDGSTIIYRYDGTFDGLLTSIFFAYENRIPVMSVTHSEDIQTGFEQKISYIETDLEKSRRVERGILNKIGGTAMHLISVIFWSGEPSKDTVIYRYIRAGFALGRKIYDSLTHPDVLPANNLYRNITREEQRVKGFVRFSLMENGIYYARIEPKNSLVPIMMPHFCDRFNDMPFILHDAAHGLAGYYQGSDWQLIESPQIPEIVVTEDEHEMRRIWRSFYDVIAVEGRINPKLNRGMMPKFYWKNMPEMEPRYSKEQIELKKSKNSVTVWEDNQWK